jgi:multidrug efflux system membrane fusion protein
LTTPLIARPAPSWCVQASLNSDRGLLPGEFVHVRLLAADQPNALLLPQVALGSSQFGQDVYLAEKGLCNDRLRSAQPMLIASMQGAKVGEEVIVGDLQKLAPRKAVQPFFER